MKHKKTILIVEDDTFLVDAYKVKLSKMPWNIITTGNGDEAYSLVIKQRPDLIILDLLIEGMTGVDVLRKIRETAEVKNTPIIIATNIDQNESAIKAKELGANDYFVKSNISINDLIAKCEKYL